MTLGERHYSPSLQIKTILFVRFTILSWSVQTFIFWLDSIFQNMQCAFFQNMQHKKPNNTAKSVALKNDIANEQHFSFPQILFSKTSFNNEDSYYLHHLGDKAVWFKGNTFQNTQNAAHSKISKQCFKIGKPHFRGMENGINRHF